MLPSVAFDVRGPAAKRTVQRVSVPLACGDKQSVTGWAEANTFAPVGAGGRFGAHGIGFALRGRFVSPRRAEVTVHTREVACNSSVRYVVHHEPYRIQVRSGRFLALVEGDKAGAQLEVSAFGRMVLVEYFEGSVTATCSDGSQRPLPLAGPDEVILAAPIRPTGGFDISAAAAGSRIRIAGGFDGGSVAALIDLTNVLPDGTSCRARGPTLVGSLAFPEITGGSGEYIPGPPVQPPQ